VDTINVLVVDDLPDMRRSLQKELERSGFAVETAQDCLEAMDKIQKHSFHVSIVDLHMPDFDGQLSPTAGLDLIRRMKKENPEIEVIVLTGEPSIDTVKEALRLGAADYFEKSLGAGNVGGKVLSVLPPEMKDKLVKATSINFDLVINFGPGTHLIKTEDEQVFRRLFLDVSEINVVEIARGTKSTAIYRVDARDAMGWRAPVAVKVDWKDAVLATKKNFEAYVKGRISEFRYAGIERVAYSTRRAGIIMAFMDTSIKDLTDLSAVFRQSSSADMVRVLENLFGDALKYWHGHRVRASLFVMGEYQSYLNWDRDQVEKALRRYLPDNAVQEIIHLDEASITFKNPFYLLDGVEQKYKGFLAQTYTSIVHGDLNTTNVLVDKRHNCWIIDFANTGESHILRDFVELETSLKFDAQECDDLRALCELEQVLIAQRRFDQEPSWSHNDPRIQKGFEAVKTVRRFAHRAIGVADMSEYYIGLLYYSLNMLRFLEKQVSAERKKCILFSASLICQALNEVV
jgi:DNA-binding response OmpR family regulator